MKLVHAHTRTVVELADVSLPPYAILSHTRDDRSPSLRTNAVAAAVGRRARRDGTPPHLCSNPVSSPPPYTTTTTKAGSLPFHIKNRPYVSDARKTPSALYADKLERACELARRSRIDYIWIAELCIDKTSTADLDNAVNGSRRRLRNAAVCFAYLHDLPAGPAPTTPTSTTPPGAVDPAVWGRCRYWKRAWTLQELILSPRVLFYDGQWNYRGSKDSPELTPLLAGITRVPRGVLLGSRPLSDVALAARIAWCAGRAAKREEDKVYALVALTGATLSVRYGEGAAAAFLRLQEELLHNTRDSSLLAWRSARDDEVRGLLARSPEEFGHLVPATDEYGEEDKKAPRQRPWVFGGRLRFSNQGIELESRVCRGPGGVLLLSIGQESPELGALSKSCVALCLREWNGVYVRVAPPTSRVPASTFYNWRSVDVVRDVEDSCALSLRSVFSSMSRTLTRDDPWRQGLWLPPVVQDSGGVTQHQHQEEDVDVKMEDDDVALPLSPQLSHTPPSNHSDGSYVHVAMTGSWMAAQDDDKQPTTIAPLHQDTYSDPGAEDDAFYSADSDLGSMSSHSASASASVTESEWEDDYYKTHRSLSTLQRENYHHNYLYAAMSSFRHADDDADAIITDTHSNTTLTAADAMADENGEANRSNAILMSSEVRKAVLDVARKRVLPQSVKAKYVMPDPDKRPPKSRINSTQQVVFDTESLKHVQASGTTTQQQFEVSALIPTGFFHLACPFFAADPQRHRNCILQGADIDSIEAVFTHLRQGHEAHPYCAYCHKEFPGNAPERDAHMQRRECKDIGHASESTSDRKGVDEYTLRKLEQKDRDFSAVHHGEATRWHHIYNGLFPDQPPAPVDPYLSSGKALAVSVFHDLWNENREVCVSIGLKKCGYSLDELNNGDLEDLYKGTLEVLIPEIYWSKKLEHLDVDVDV